MNIIFTHADQAFHTDDLVSNESGVTASGRFWDRDEGHGDTVTLFFPYTSIHFISLDIEFEPDDATVGTSE